MEVEVDDGDSKDTEIMVLPSPKEKVERERTLLWLSFQDTATTSRDCAFKSDGGYTQ